jgi:hypothetical protein
MGFERRDLALIRSYLIERTLVDYVFNATDWAASHMILLEYDFFRKI